MSWSQTNLELYINRGVHIKNPHTRIIINTGHLKMSLVVAGRKIPPRRLVVAVK